MQMSIVSSSSLGKSDPSEAPATLRIACTHQIFCWPNRWLAKRRVMMADSWFIQTPLGHCSSVCAGGELSGEFVTVEYVTVG